MAEPIGALRAEMSAGYAGFISDLQKAKQGVQVNAAGMSSAMASVRTSFDNTTRSLLGMRGAMVALAGATSLGVVMKKSIDTAEEMYKLSQKTGMSTEKLSGLAYAADLAEVPLEDLGKSLEKLSKSTGKALDGSGDAKTAYKALGIEIKNADGSVKSSDQLLLALADKFAALQDGTEKTSLAMKFFGKSGADMIPLLNMGSKGIKEATDQAQRMGLILSTDAAISAEIFNDQINEFKGAGEGFARSILTDVLPGLVEYIKTVKQAYEDSGPLMAMWVALGGIGEAMVTKGLARKIKDAQDEIADLERQKKESLAQPTAWWVDMKERAAIYDEQINKVKAELKSLQDQQNANLEKTKANAQEQADLNAKDMERKAKLTITLRKNLQAAADAEDAEKKAKAEKEQAIKRGNEMITTMERELTVTHDLSREEKARWELDQGKDKGLTDKQKEKIIGLAQELDVLDQVLAAEKERKAVMDQLDGEISNLQVTQGGLDLELKTSKGAFDNVAIAVKLYEASLKGATDEQLEAMGIQLNDIAVMTRAAQVINDARTAQDIYNVTLSELNELLANGSITLEQYDNGLKKANETLLATDTTAFGEVKRAIVGASDALATFCTTGKMDFNALANSILHDLIRIQMQELLTKSFGSMSSSGGLLQSIGTAIFDAYSGGGGSVMSVNNAKGNAFNRGNVIPFARGGVVDSPTIFPMARGMGLMGEAGPEAVMPLTRGVNGELGVKSEGGGGSVSQYFISCMDSKSLEEYVKRNAGIFQNVTTQGLRDNKTRREFKSLMR